MTDLEIKTLIDTKAVEQAKFDDQLADNAIDAAVSHIQEAFGQTDERWADAFFSCRDGEKYNQLRDILREYITLERERANADSRSFAYGLIQHIPDDGRTGEFWLVNLYGIDTPRDELPDDEETFNTEAGARALAERICDDYDFE